MFGDMKKAEVEVADGVGDLGDGIGDLFEVFEKEDMTPSLQPCRTSYRKYFSSNNQIFSPARRAAQRPHLLRVQQAVPGQSDHRHGEQVPSQVLRLHLLPGTLQVNIKKRDCCVAQFVC